MYFHEKVLVRQNFVLTYRWIIWQMNTLKSFDAILYGFTFIEYPNDYEIALHKWWFSLISEEWWRASCKFTGKIQFLRDKRTLKWCWVHDWISSKDHSYAFILFREIKALHEISRKCVCWDKWHTIFRKCVVFLWKRIYQPQCTKIGDIITRN